MKKETTKICRDCGYDRFTLLRSMNLKICCRCGLHIEWVLDDGQLPVGYELPKTGEEND